VSATLVGAAHKRLFGNPEAIRVVECRTNFGVGNRRKGKEAVRGGRSNGTVYCHSGSEHQGGKQRKLIRVPVRPEPERE